MGYGGDLMLAASIAEYHNHTGYKVALVKSPKFSDLVCGRIYSPLEDISNSPIFINSPYIKSIDLRSHQRSKAMAFIDKIFDRLINLSLLQDRVGSWLQQRCYKHAQKTGVRYLYKDDIRFSYAAVIYPDRMEWQDSPNAVAAVLEGFLEEERPIVKHPQPTSNFYGLEDELEAVQTLMQKNGLTKEKFIIIEPSTNADWFADIRAWPMERWEQLVNNLQQSHPDIKIVRVGVHDETYTEGVIDLRGQTTFREVAALMGQSKLFIGTEGGLMHAAGAVGVPAVIIWGGLTLPDFAGYPDKHVILEHRVACAPCGLLGNCPNNKICINSIKADDVTKACEQALSHYSPRILTLSSD